MWESMAITDFSAQVTVGELVGEEVKNPGEWKEIFLPALSFLFKNT